jgi:hypothetical protein
VLAAVVPAQPVVARDPVAEKQSGVYDGWAEAA